MRQEMFQQHPVRVSIKVDETAKPTISTGTTRTSDTNPTISGTAEANSTINLISDGSSIGTATTDGSGNFSVTPSSELSEGSYSLTVTATDAAGNVLATSDAVVFTIDTTAPDIPVIETKDLTVNPPASLIQLLEPQNLEAS